jgi:hypothetical protein
MPGSQYSELLVRAPKAVTYLNFALHLMQALKRRTYSYEQAKHLHGVLKPTESRQ